MRPTDSLIREHRVIEQVLDCLERLALDARDRKRLDLRLAGDVLRFLIDFADRMHHGKEERHLFPLMHSRGVPRHAGPVAVMLNEHDIGRAEIARMRASLEHDVSAFVEAALEYVELLREHIAKEDQVLFPLAESLLNDEDRRQALAAFERIELEELGEGGFLRFADLADRISIPLGVTCGAARAQGPLAHGASVRSEA